MLGLTAMVVVTLGMRYTHQHINICEEWWHQAKLTSRQSSEESTTQAILRSYLS